MHADTHESIGMMRRSGVARIALAFLVFYACLVGTSRAELLQRFHVLGFALTSDVQRPRVNVPFHVTMTIHVRENVTRLQYVYFPTISGLDNRGDQRSLTHISGGGSIYRETLTLVSHKPGPVAIGSAYLDAVDLRDSKTKRFISNDLILNVLGTAVSNDGTRLRTLLLVILALLLLAAVLGIFFRRRRRVPEKHEPVPDGAVAPRTAPPIPLDQAFANLRAHRDRSSVLDVREALWNSVGANSGETLDNVLQREPARSDGFRRILIAIEHAAFVHDAHLQQAIENALSEAAHGIAR